MIPKMEKTVKAGLFDELKKIAADGKISPEYLMSPFSLYRMSDFHLSKIKKKMPVL